jgi:hypothetical protein
MGNGALVEGTKGALLADFTSPAKGTRRLRATLIMRER